MPLPKISTPTYELVLPSTGKKISYRPFLVREEKLLVLALESENTKEITTAIKNVLKACIQTRGVKVEQLPTFDIEYLFLNIRGKSVGEEIEVNILCPDDGGDTYVPVKINIDEIEVKKNKDHTPIIKLDDTLSMELKYPSLSEFIKNNFDFSEDKQMEASFEMVATCIDKIYSEEEVWDSSDCTKKELLDFLEQMNSAQFKQVEFFFETMPKLTHTVKVTNPTTQIESEVNLEGLSSFFA